MMGRDFGRVIERVVGEVSKPAGFKKERRTWRRSTSDRIEVLNIQASQWSPLYYINYGVYLKCLGTLENPHVSDCQFQSRLSGEQISHALDAEDSSVSQEQKLVLIELEVRTVLLPSLLVFDDLQAVAEKYERGDLPFQILGLTPDEFLRFARSGKVPQEYWVRQQQS